MVSGKENSGSLAQRGRLWDLMPKGRARLAFLHDVLAVVFAWCLAYLLRFNFEIPHNFSSGMIEALVLILPIQSLAFIAFGLYRGVWRFASIPDLHRILQAVMIGTFVTMSLLYVSRLGILVPRSVFFLDPILLLLVMAGSRFAYRAWKEHRLYGQTQLQGNPVLILGSGEAAIALLKDLARSPEWRVTGILDDAAEMHGRQVYGIKILGPIDRMEQIAADLDVNHVIVAMPSAHHEQRRRAVQIANRAGLTALTVPAFDDLMSGKVSISEIRRVEVEDLLGRESVNLDDEGMHALLEGNVVLVTGAGGSIGSELCRQIVRYQPDTLVCLDISEYALYQLDQEFKSLNTPCNMVFVTADVKNEQRLKGILGQYKPSVVFHAAAYKHVPLMERHNVAEALMNNAVGTYTVARLSKEAKVAKFVLVSTDKAVNPTNVMGASKRLAEMVCQGLQDATGTRFVIVRFGNVLGSSGSVIPKFREQIAKGGPVTVTHPEITRYFMSIPEACQLVMQAGLMGEGGEIFVLDMGTPVKIVDLAKDMIRLSGFTEGEIEIEFTGLRPGEKLYEELLADDEHTLPTPHEKLRIAIARTADKAWVKSLLKWVVSCYQLDETTIKRELKLWVEEYQGDVHQQDNGRAPQLVPKSSTIH